MISDIQTTDLARRKLKQQIFNGLRDISWESGNQYLQKQVLYMIFVKVYMYIYLPEFLTFCSIVTEVKRLTFAYKDAKRKQSIGGTALENSHDMKMTRYRRCHDIVGSAYNSDTGQPRYKVIFGVHINKLCYK